jgi:hypothetical protein
MNILTIIFILLLKMQCIIVMEFFVLIKILKNTKMKIIHLILIILLSTFSCSKFEDNHVGTKEKMVNNSIHFEKNQNARNLFFKNGNLDLIQKKFLKETKTLTELEKEYDYYVNTNISSPYLLNYKAVFSTMAIEKYNLVNMKSSNDKKLFIKHFDSLFEMTGGDSKTQSEILSKVKPHLTSNEYEHYLSEVNNTKKENINKMERILHVFKDNAEREANSDNKKKMEFAINTLQKNINKEKE